MQLRRTSSPWSSQDIRYLLHKCIFWKWGQFWGKQQNETLARAAPSSGAVPAPGGRAAFWKGSLTWQAGPQTVPRKTCLFYQVQQRPSPMLASRKVLPTFLICIAYLNEKDPENSHLFTLVHYFPSPAHSSGPSHLPPSPKLLLLLPLKILIPLLFPFALFFLYWGKIHMKLTILKWTTQ